MGELKKDAFINTFKKKDTKWYSWYTPEHLVVALLKRFKLVKIKIIAVWQNM